MHMGCKGNCAFQTTTCLYFATVLRSVPQTHAQVHAHTCTCTRHSSSLASTAVTGMLTGTGFGGPSALFSLIIHVPLQVHLSTDAWSPLLNPLREHKVSGAC